MTVLNPETPPSDSPPAVDPSKYALPANAPQEDAPPAGMPRAVVIKVRRQNGSIAKFKIRANSKFKKMMKTYCSLHDLPFDSVRFLYNGIQVQRLDTPISLDMEGSVIMEVIHDF